MHQDANLSFSCPCVGSFLARHDDLELGATKIPVQIHEARSIFFFILLASPLYVCIQANKQEFGP